MKKQKRVCAVCKNEFEETSESAGCKDNFTKKVYRFCPRTTPEEIVDFIVKNKIGQKWTK